MANVTVTTSNPSITVNQTNNTISVSTVTSNVTVGEVSPVTIPLNLITASGTFATLNVGNTSTTQYTFPTDAPTVDQGLRAHANGVLYWSEDVGLVDSVNGYTGVVVLDTGDISEGSNQYYTDARVDSRLSSGNVGNITITGKNTSAETRTELIYSTGDTLTLGTETGTKPVDSFGSNVRIVPGNFRTGGGVDINSGTRLVVGDDSQAPYQNFLGGHQSQSLAVGGRLSVNQSLDLGGRYLYIGADQYKGFSTYQNDTTPGNVSIQFGVANANIAGNNTRSTFAGIRASNKTRDGVTDYSMKMGWFDPIPQDEPNFDSGATNWIPFSDLADTKVATTFTDSVSATSFTATTGNITGAISTNSISPTSGTVVTVDGSLEVNGNLNVVEKVDLLLQDNKIVLNYGNVTARDAFIDVDRSGSSLANAQLKWNETTDRWQISNDGSTYSDIFVDGDSISTTDLTVTNVLSVDTIDNNTGTDVTITADLDVVGDITSENITNNTNIVTTNLRATTLSETAEARPLSLTNKYAITSDNLLLAQTGLEGGAPTTQGGSIGEGVFKWGELQWEGIEPTSVNSNVTKSGSNVIPTAWNLIGSISSGSSTFTVTGYANLYDYLRYGDNSVSTSAISTFITDNINTNSVVSQADEPIGSIGTVGHKEQLLYVVSTDPANNTITFNAPADATLTADSDLANGKFYTVGEGFYNANTGVRVSILDGTFNFNNPGSNTDVGYYTVVNTSTKNNNVELGLDDVTFSGGLSASDFSNTDENVFKGRSYWKIGKNATGTDLFKNEITFRAPRGIVVGNNTELGNRPFNDYFEVNGMNIGWDGLSESLGDINDSRRLPVTQIGLSSYTNFSGAREYSDYRSLAGTRLMFSAFEGDVNSPRSEQYPRAGSEIGRVMAWGRSQTVDNSTYIPPSKLSFYASNYTSNNKTTDFVLSASTNTSATQRIATDSTWQNTAKNSNSLHLSGDQVFFGPTGASTQAQNRATLEKYAMAGRVQSTNTGSALYAYNGKDTRYDNDIELGLWRDTTAFADSTISLNRGKYQEPGSTTELDLINFYSIGNFGLGGDAVQINNRSREDSFPEDFVNGMEVELNGFSGSFGTAVNGNTYYAQRDFGILVTLFTDSGLTTGLNTGVANNTNIDVDGTATLTFKNKINQYAGSSGALYSWKLPIGTNDLYMYKDGHSGTQLWRYDNIQQAFKYGSIGVEADAFTGDLTGDVTGTVSDISNHQSTIRGYFNAGTGLAYDSGTGEFRLSDTDLISGVTAGSGLTGGGDTGNVTLNVGAGNGITVNANDIAVDMSVFSTTDLSEGTNLYYTDARADARVNLQTGNNLDLSFKSTADLSENTNLYFTDTRAQTAASTLLASFSTNVLTTGNITGNDITANGDFFGDIDGAVLLDVYNNTGSTLNKGDAVYLTGGNDGDNPHVDLADADDATKMPAIGIIRENIVSGVGQVVTSGVMNFSSHGFTAGADLYIDHTTPGGLTETPPTGENRFIQKIGKVVSGNHILVQGAFRTNATPNLNDGKVFIGNSSNQTVTATLDTSIVPENTNLYYTDARVDARLNSGSVASITADDITLKKFNETTIALGNQSGDVSSTIDLDNGSIFQITATGALTINSLGNAVAGSSGVIIITQDGTGSRTLTTGANIKWAGGLNTLSTGINEIDLINFMYDGTTYYFSLTKGYA